MTLLVAPAAALAALTIVMYLAAAGAASFAVSRREISRDDVKIPSGGGPVWLERIRRNYMNLCEMPMLFYAAVAIHIALGRLDETFVAMAWAYVGLRYAHSVFHVFVNELVFRFALFVASAGVLGAMWLRLATGG